MLIKVGAACLLAIWQLAGNKLLEVVKGAAGGQQSAAHFALAMSDQGVKAADVCHSSTVLTVPTLSSELGAIWQLFCTQACAATCGHMWLVYCVQRTLDELEVQDCTTPLGGCKSSSCA